MYMSQYLQKYTLRNITTFIAWTLKIMVVMTGESVHTVLEEWCQLGLLFSSEHESQLSITEIVKWLSSIATGLIAEVLLVVRRKNSARLI